MSKRKPLTVNRQAYVYLSDMGGFASTEHPDLVLFATLKEAKKYFVGGHEQPAKVEVSIRWPCRHKERP